MAQGMSRALDDCMGSDNSRMVAGGATLFRPRGSTMGAAAPGRPRWDLLNAAGAMIDKLEPDAASLRTTLDEPFGFDAIIGRAPKFMAAIDAARKVGATATTVLLTGESGTGKEVLARAIHQGSGRSDRPFVALNCAALPETLVESELFGHERGAFTGADRLKRGRFELAAGGTLFLDEIGELTPAVQAKLLRVLQERRYGRVGGTTTLDADIRLIAATNRDLERAVADGRFREDLYYRVAVFRIHLPTLRAGAAAGTFREDLYHRLAVVTLTLPPLRERGDDVERLARHFLALGAARHGLPVPALSPAVLQRLTAHAWPGNVRELRNAVERALILSPPGRIDPAALMLEPALPPEARASALPFPAPLGDIDRAAAIAMVRLTGGDKTEAAKRLGVSRPKLIRLLRT